MPGGSRYLSCVGNKQAVPREGGILKLQEQYFRVFAVSFVLMIGDVSVYGSLRRLFLCLVEMALEGVG